jgi:aminomethyltransferase
MNELRRTPLHDLHRESGARMVPFAGWEMPLQYKGVLAEHAAARESAALFDVSHMGQYLLSGPDPARALERLVPADILGLAPNRQRYVLLTNDAGGILDDLMVANFGEALFLVVNAANADADAAHIRSGLPGHRLERCDDRALVALQGPRAEAALERIAPAVARLGFLEAAKLPIPGGEIWVSRSGYTGEDGFEISVPVSEALGFATALLSMTEVVPAGLGARDTLRLEAGLPLHGADIDPDTNPVEAGLAWSIGKSRRDGGARQGGFPGAGPILAALASGPARRRVGLLPEGRSPMRAGVQLLADDAGVGTVTSGAWGPSLGRPVAMGYVDARHAEPGTILAGEVRGRRVPVEVTRLPFRDSNYKR